MQSPYSTLYEDTVRLLLNTYVSPGPQGRRLHQGAWGSAQHAKRTSLRNGLPCQGL